jgi:hypothetical protein
VSPDLRCPSNPGQLSLSANRVVGSGLGGQGWGPGTFDGLSQASELNLVLSQAMHSHTQGDYLEYGRSLRRGLDLAVELYTMPHGSRSKSATLQLRATDAQFTRWLEFGAATRLAHAGSRLIVSVNRRWRDAQDLLPILGGCAGGLLEVATTAAPELLDEAGMDESLFTAALLTVWVSTPTPSFELPQRNHGTLATMLVSTRSKLDPDLFQMVAVAAERYGWAQVQTVAGFRHRTGTGGSSDALPRSTQPPPPAGPGPIAAPPPTRRRSPGFEGLTQPPPPDADARPGGWYPDPTRRFAKRFFDGRSWTDQVASAWGAVEHDPYDG